MEVKSWPSGGAGDRSMVPPSNTRRIYQRLPAMYSFESTQTPGSPRSTHTDTDTAMEMGGLSMAPGGPDLHHVTPRASAPLVTQRTMSTPDLAATPRATVVAKSGVDMVLWVTVLCYGNPGEIHPASTGEWGWLPSSWPGGQCRNLGTLPETPGHHPTSYVNQTSHYW